MAPVPWTSMGASTAAATRERMPSAPTTHAACQATLPRWSRPTTPSTLPFWSRWTSVTVTPYRNVAPAARAASTRIGSSTVRRGAYSASTPWAGLMGTVTSSVA